MSGSLPRFVTSARRRARPVTATAEQLPLLRPAIRCASCADLELVARTVRTHSGALSMRLEPCPDCVGARDEDPR